MFQLYQINDDGGYSTCRIENIGYTEHLPDDTLYHIYEWNGEMIDSKNENDREDISNEFLPLEMPKKWDFF